MRSQKQQTTAKVEVLAVLSPRSGEEPMTFRVAMHSWQLQDMRRNTPYAAAVFDAFRITVCEGLNLDVDTCPINVNLNAEPCVDAEDDALHTGDVLSELLFLH